jgi:hypothetical protein
MRGHDDVLALADVGDARIDARAVKYVKSAHSTGENVSLKTPPAESCLARKVNRRALEVSHATFDRRN